MAKIWIENARIKKQFFITKSNEYVLTNVLNLKLIFSLEASQIFSTGSVLSTFLIKMKPYLVPSTQNSQSSVKHPDPVDHPSKNGKYRPIRSDYLFCCVCPSFIRRNGGYFTHISKPKIQWEFVKLNSFFINRIRDCPRIRFNHTPICDIVVT